jgi:flagellar basal-body rod protein FlgB
MDFSKLDFFSVVAKKMAYVSERQAVLAKNIANADTPNYKPSDLLPFHKAVSANMIGGLQMAVTDPKHMQSASSNMFASIQEKGDDPTPNGNAVDVVDEAQKMQDNALAYQSLTSIYAKMADFIRTVVTDK